MWLEGIRPPPQRGRCHAVLQRELLSNPAHSVGASSNARMMAAMLLGCEHKLPSRHGGLAVVTNGEIGPKALSQAESIPAKRPR